MRQAVKPAPAARAARAAAPAGKARAAPARKHALKAAAHSVVPADSMRAAVTHLKRERIIAAAAGLFYADGFVNTTLDAVAKRLHLTKPFLYAHFGSKSELLGVICVHGIRASSIPSPHRRAP